MKILRRILGIITFPFFPYVVLWDFGICIGMGIKYDFKESLTLVWETWKFQFGFSDEN